MTDYKLVEKYILDSIDLSGYLKNQPKDNKNKLKFALDTFKSEYGYKINEVGMLKALADYLQGLPSTFNIAFYNSDIVDLAKLWGGLDKDSTEKQEQKILDNYWNFMATNIIKLWRKYKLI